MPTQGLIDVDLGGPYLMSAPWSAWERLADVGPQVRRLDLYRLPEGREAEAVELVRALQLPRLELLQIYLSVELLTVLLDKPLPRLRELHLDAEQAALPWDALLAAPWLARLRRLRLDGCALIGRFERLAGCHALEELVLDLMQSDDDGGQRALTAADVRALAALPALTRLDLSLTRVTPAVVAALSETGLAERVEVVVEAWLTEERVEDAVLESIVRAAQGQPAVAQLVRALDGARAREVELALRFEEQRVVLQRWARLRRELETSLGVALLAAYDGDLHDLPEAPVDDPDGSGSPQAGAPRDRL